MSRRHRPGRSSAALVALLTAVLAGCGQAAAPTPTPTPAAPTATPVPALSPGVTVDGTTVTIVGVGRSTSDPFELPAGSAVMRITACRSNQVMPFITLYEGSGQSAGLIVDPEKVLNNLAGGDYTVTAQANPDCVWQVTITPQ